MYSSRVDSHDSRVRRTIAVTVVRARFSIVVLCDVGWLGSRVVSVLDSGAEGAVAICLRQIAQTHRASVHQASKLVAALLRSQ